MEALFFCIYMLANLKYWFTPQVHLVYCTSIILKVGSHRNKFSKNIV